MQFRVLSARLPRLVWSILALAFASLVLTAGVASAAPPDANKQQGPPSTANIGAPSPELTAQWWQSFMPLNEGSSALDRCDVGTADIVFLAGTAGGSETRSCTISSKQSILVPIINVECSTVEGNGKTPAELTSCARAFGDRFTSLHFKVDGKPVVPTKRFRVTSGAFTFTMAKNNPFGAGPPEGSTVELPATTLSVSDGYWALIPPLPVGTHTITFGGKYPPGKFTTAATYTLTVR
jgi:hypothetical protein